MTCNSCKASVENSMNHLDQVTSSDADVRLGELTLVLNKDIDLKLLQDSIPKKYIIKDEISSPKKLGKIHSDSTNSDSKLKQLKPCEFEFKADTDNVVHQGFLAHEVDNIVPTSVFGEKDGEEMQQLDHSKLVPLLVKTIQELEARIKVLES